MSTVSPAGGTSQTAAPLPRRVLATPARPAVSLSLPQGPQSGEGAHPARSRSEIDGPMSSTGAMLREARNEDSLLRRAASGIRERGELISDAMITDIASERPRTADTLRGCV